MDDDSELTLWGKPVALDEDCPRGNVYWMQGKLHVHPDDYEQMAGE